MELEKHILQASKQAELAQAKAAATAASASQGSHGGSFVMKMVRRPSQLKLEQEKQQEDEKPQPFPGEEEPPPALAPTAVPQTPLLRKHDANDLSSRVMRAFLPFLYHDDGKKTFTGHEFINWLIREGLAREFLMKSKAAAAAAAAAASAKPDAKPPTSSLASGMDDLSELREFGRKMGQALLEHRLAHHITDDADFLDSPNHQYIFLSQEPIEVRMLHSALGQFIAKPEIFHQGNLELKSRTLFGGETWTHVYAVLDDASAKPRMLHFFKRKSAASKPIASYAVEECMCSLEECLDCKTDWYCFQLKVQKHSGKDIFLTLCADHSKRQEGWMEALMNAGVEYIKEEEGTDLSAVKSIFELSAKKLNSDEIIPLSNFKGKVCLVTNVASK